MKRLLKGSVSLLQLLFPPMSDVCRLQSNEVKHQRNCEMPRIPFSKMNFIFIEPQNVSGCSEAHLNCLHRTRIQILLFYLGFYYFFTFFNGDLYWRGPNIT